MVVTGKKLRSNSAAQIPNVYDLVLPEETEIMEMNPTVMINPKKKMGKQPPNVRLPRDIRG